ncbi:MAG: MotA/TolQ/ExbB proton channel family protein [Deltaproteobacteria bacterium]|nr:MotA/TolQ/ExbB proton channel family protein [Deltaproteobacteria bacterium]
MSPLAFFLTVAAPDPNSENVTNGFSVINAVFQADPVVKLTLAILILFSICAWTVILLKFFQLKRAKRSSRKFYDIFQNSHSLEELLTQKVPQEGNPLYAVFSVGLGDILKEKQVKAKNPAHQSRLNLESVRQKIQMSVTQEARKLEQLAPFLATTASTAPFIGLFGTVWGILASFTLIAQGGGGFEVVGPKISEALVATAVGLATAIPAVMAYNYFVTRIKHRSTELNNFAEDLTQRIQQEYF